MTGPIDLGAELAGYTGTPPPPRPTPDLDTPHDGIISAIHAYSSGQKHIDCPPDCSICGDL